jgi:hypothetical protein
MPELKSLQISPNLSLPAEDFLESAMGIIGKRGRGKTGCVKVIMEELFKVKLPFIAFDPVGVMWGLRSSIDGTGVGLPVLIIGGSHGDLRLDRRAGAEVAKAIVQANISCIIDFSEEPKAVYREFVRDFAHMLFKINDTPRMVIIEEAPELVPQRLRPEMGEVFEAVERLVSRGRNKGIGVILVSQRAATLNKDVMTQIDSLLVFGLTSPQDRKALKEWVEGKDDEHSINQFDEGIAGLKNQEAWFWSPEAFGGQFKKIRVRNFTTFHPDKTHLRRQGLLERKPVTTDVTGIVASLNVQLSNLSKEKTDISTIPKLKKRIEGLEAELSVLKNREGNSTYNAGHLQKVLNDTQKNAIQFKNLYESEVKERRRLGEEMKELSENFTELATKMLKKSGSVVLPPHQTVSVGTVNLAGEKRTVTVTNREENPVRIITDPSEQIRSGEMRILKTLTMRHPLRLTRVQLGTLSGFKASGGTFRTYFNDMKRRGFLLENNGSVSVTQEGLDFAGEIPKQPSGHEEIMAMWKNNLRRGEGIMLEEVARVHPDSISRGELAEKTNFTALGGTFRTYLGVLRRNGLITVDGDDIRANDILFGDD